VAAGANPLTENRRWEDIKLDCRAAVLDRLNKHLIFAADEYPMSEVIPKPNRDIQKLYPSVWEAFNELGDRRHAAERRHKEQR
jgi:hypothetical protein